MVGDPREDDADPPEDESTLPISQLSPSCHGTPALTSECRDWKSQIKH